jgi:ribokinase
MKPILVIGSSNTDLVAAVERLPGEGETVMGSRLERFAGGKGANQAVAAARAGATVFFAGAVGSDDFGNQAVLGFEKDGLDLKYLKRLDGIPSGTALIAVDHKGKNQIIVIPGTNAHVFPADLEPIDFTQFGIVVFQLEIPHETVWAGLRKAKEAGCITILNPAPADDIPVEVFPYMDYLIPNEHELALIAGAGSLEEQAATVRARGVEHLVVTLGKDGACCFGPDGRTDVPAPDLPVVDTVGAGDCFVGVFAALLNRGMELGAALRYAAAGASVSVGRPGAQSSYVHWNEIREVAENA